MFPMSLSKKYNHNTACYTIFNNWHKQAAMVRLPRQGGKVWIVMGIVLAINPFWQLLPPQQLIKYDQPRKKFRFYKSLTGSRS